MQSNTKRSIVISSGIALVCLLFALGLVLYEVYWESSPAISPAISHQMDLKGKITLSIPRTMRIGAHFIGSGMVQLWYYSPKTAMHIDVTGVTFDALDMRVRVDGAPKDERASQGPPNIAAGASKDMRRLTQRFALFLTPDYAHLGHIRVLAIVTPLNGAHMVVADRVWSVRITKTA